MQCLGATPARGAGSARSRIPPPERNGQDPVTEDDDQLGGLIAETRSFAEIIREELETRQASPPDTVTAER